MRPIPARAWGLGAAVIAYGLDQASKIAVVRAFAASEGVRIELMPLLDLVLVWNRGASFGLFAEGGGWVAAILLVTTCAIVALCAAWLWRARASATAIALGLILGGGAGNLHDRLLHGAVVDFINPKLFGLYYPYIFNLADVFLGLGATLFFITEWRRTGRGAAETVHPGNSHP